MEWIIKLNRSKHLDCIVPPPLSDFSSLEVVWMTSESYSMCFLLLISLPYCLFVFLSEIIFYIFV